MSRVLSSFDSIIVSNDKLYNFEPNDLTSMVIGLDTDVQSSVTINKPTIIDCFNISICKRWLAVCFKKELRLFYNCEFRSSAAIDKCATRVMFFNTQNIILVADRSGGVCFYNFSDNAIKKLDETMGHNSVLTDAIISSNDKFIITSDRDEKIRVSCYPNVYNIQSFCLGHEQFVSSISFLPTDENVLVSSSGDGTIRLWDYKVGCQLLLFRVPCTEKSIVKAICIPSEGESLLIVQFYKSDELSILSVTGTRQQNLSIAIKTSVTVHNLIDFSPFRNTIICLTKETPKLRLLKLKEDKDDQSQQFVQNAAKGLQDVDLTSSVDSFNIMFKREFDNVLEYQEKKKARIVNKLSKLN